MNLKDFMMYKRNKKIIKKETAKILANILPMLTTFLQDNDRILELINYVSTLSEDDIKKILIHAEVETMHDKEDA